MPIVYSTTWKQGRVKQFKTSNKMYVLCKESDIVRNMKRKRNEAHKNVREKAKKRKGRRWKHVEIT